MIMTVNGAVNMIGSTPEICTDVTNILTSFRKVIADKYGKEAEEDFVAKVVKTSAMTDEEIQAETQALKEKIMNKSKAESDAFVSDFMKIIMRGMGE